MRSLLALVLVAGGCTDWEALLADCFGRGHCVGDAGDAGDGGTADAGLTFEALCAELADGVCVPAVKCGVTHSIAGCRDVLGREYLGEACPEKLRLAVDAGTIRFDPVAAALCLSLIRGDGGCVLLTNVGTDCLRTFSATRMNGAACAYDEECVGEAYCTATCPGTCRMRVATGPAGQPNECASDSYWFAGMCFVRKTADAGCAADECGKDLYCLGGICRPLDGNGAPCTFSSRCGLGLACINGACAPFLGLGARCEPRVAGSRLDTVCKTDLHCDVDGLFDAGVCRAAVAGNRCLYHYDCVLAQYCLGAAIEADGGLQHGTCVDRLALGVPCPATGTGYVECGVGLLCGDAGTCRAFGGAGTSCFSTVGCQSGFVCNADRCEALCPPPP